MNFNDQNFLNVLILLLVVSTGLCIGYILRLFEKVKYWKKRAHFFETDNDALLVNFHHAMNGQRELFNTMREVRNSISVMPTPVRDLLETTFRKYNV